MRLATIIVLCLFGCATQLKYNYASSDARVHCSLDCPGRDCICTLGEDKTWYINPEIGDE